MGENHVYPDPDGARGTSIPSSVPLDAASLTAGTVSVGAAAVGAMTGTSFMIPPSLTSSVSWTLPLVLHPLSTGYLTVVIIFGSLSVLLGAVNLFWGLSRKKKLAEQMRKHQADLDDLCQKAGVAAP